MGAHERAGHYYVPVPGKTSRGMKVDTLNERISFGQRATHQKHNGHQCAGIQSPKMFGGTRLIARITPSSGSGRSGYNWRAPVDFAYET